jgi:hypothetical protein
MTGDSRTQTHADQRALMQGHPDRIPELLRALRQRGIALELDDPGMWRALIAELRAIDAEKGGPP